MCQVKADEVQQLVVFQLGQMQLGAAFQQIMRELPLRFDERVDLFLDRSAADELVHQHVLGLPDAEGAIGGLILDRGIPPAVEVHDVRGRGEVEAGAAGFQGQHEEGHRLVFLKLAHQCRALLDRCLAVQDEPGATEDLAEKRRQRRGDLAELGEHQHLLLLGRDDLGDLAQPRQLAAVGLRPATIAEPLRRMIADLLEAHQGREHEAPALDARPCLRAARPAL